MATQTNQVQIIPLYAGANASAAAAAQVITIGVPGTPGPGVPLGGTAAQYLRKQSATNFDTAWTAIAAADLPADVAYLDKAKTWTQPQTITSGWWSVTGNTQVLDEQIATPGVYLAYVGGSYRILFAGGTGTGNFEVDGGNGGFRWLFPGVVVMSGLQSANAMGLVWDMLVGGLAEACGARFWVRDNDISRPICRITREASSQSAAAPHIQLELWTSTSARQKAGDVRADWADSNDATRKGRIVLDAADYAGTREGVRVEADGTQARVGFFGGSAATKPTITGSRGGNAALAALLTALASLGLITDSTTV